MDEKKLFVFELSVPPAVTEQELKMELERRTIKRQAAYLAVAAFFIELCMLLCAWLIWKTAPWLSVLCLGYVILSMTGGGILAVFCSKKGREIKWQA